MSMKLSCAAVLVILFTVISDHGLQAPNPNRGRTMRRRGDEGGSSSLVIATSRTSRGSTSGNGWKLDSVIQFEINGEHACLACLLDHRGTDLPVITTPDGDLQESIFAPGPCLEKINENHHALTAKTANGDDIPFEFNDEGVLTLLEQTNLNAIAGARKKMYTGTKGMATVWEQGKVTLKEFVIVDDEYCNIHEVYSNDFFCAENFGRRKINAGEGAPFFLKLAGRQVAMGIQAGYMGNGRNIYYANRAENVISLPGSELPRTSGGVFDFDSVINVELNGKHLCFACMINAPVPGYTPFLTSQTCSNEMKENIRYVKIKTIRGEDITALLNVVDDQLSIRNFDTTQVRTVPIARAYLPIGTRGMAAIWEKGSVAWRQFIVTDIGACGLDQSYSDSHFCIQHVGSKKVNTGNGSPFFIKVRGTQYLVGIQTRYDDGGNLYAYYPRDDQHVMDEVTQLMGQMGM